MSEIFLSQDPSAGVAVDIMLLGAYGEFAHCDSR